MLKFQNMCVLRTQGSAEQALPNTENNILHLGVISQDFGSYCSHTAVELNIPGGCAYDPAVINLKIWYE